MTEINELITKYINGADRVIKEIKEIPENVTLKNEEAETVFDWAKRYLEDAKYYQQKGKLETSLTSVAYCEGLLDALRLLGAVEFSW
jgi:FAD synthetase